MGIGKYWVGLHVLLALGKRTCWPTQYLWNSLSRTESSLGAEGRTALTDPSGSGWGGGAQKYDLRAAAATRPPCHLVRGPGGG